MARIGIDVRCLSEGRKTGVEEYVTHLLKNVFALDSENEYILFLNSFGSSRADISFFNEFSNVSFKKLNYPNKVLNFFFWFLNWPKIDTLLGGADVVFMPNIAFGSVSRKTKLVLTVHDLSFERYPETFSWKRRLWHFFVNPRKLCRQASRIIAVSESTKNDLTDVYQIFSEKIRVIYSGAGKQFHSFEKNNPELFRVKRKYNLPEHFILYLGTIEPRKNIIGIIEAYEKLQTDNQKTLGHCKLVIAGSSGWKDKKIKNAIFTSKFRKNIIFAGFVESEDKAALYNLASLFVYPSFFEGFGFPPLEAMKCGTPVIVSNNSSLPEIAGFASVLTDPHKPQEICAAMESILLSPEFSRKMVFSGIKRSGEFEWEKSARSFLELLKELSQKKNA